MADKTDTANDIHGRLAAALFPLVREYEAARSALRTHGPENWAKLLHDLRVAPAFQDDIWRRIDDSIGTLPDGASASEVLTALEKVIDDIVPIYPSEVS